MSEECQKKYYSNYFKEKNKEWESLCVRCGGCCGAYDDPCKHLKECGDNKFYCEIYSERFGARETITKDKFDCVNVRQILHTYWKNDGLCIYKKLFKRGYIGIQKD